MFLWIQSFRRGSLMEMFVPSMSIRSFFIKAFLIPWTLAELSSLYFLMTSFFPNPVVTPFATAFSKFNWSSVNPSTSLWKNTLFCSNSSSMEAVIISLVTAV